MKSENNCFKLRHGFSKIHRNDGIWQWKVGISYVLIYDPNGKRYQVSCETISGVRDWERAKYKGYDQITPSMINSWISNNE